MPVDEQQRETIVSAVESALEELSRVRESLRAHAVDLSQARAAIRAAEQRERTLAEEAQSYAEALDTLVQWVELNQPVSLVGQSPMQVVSHVITTMEAARDAAIVVVNKVMPLLIARLPLMVQEILREETP